MFIQTIPSGPFETNAYIAACPKTLIAAIIDPGVDSFNEIKHHLNSFKPDKILLTHSHWDHIGDAAKLKKFYEIPVYVHGLDTPNLIDPGSDGLPCWLEIEGVKPDVLIEEGTVVLIARVQ